ncbi:hypothetical protein ONZ51_g7852 [Trametes cubensis]|uniref:Uncharacterized protein n=1 Tax=Trametes cubensis TaxID=1111947 RepID=A0AAD7TQJ7_9APHY|nr:hypothetical protein ONZ51_g7852 [Trametes cubensis]
MLFNKPSIASESGERVAEDCKTGNPISTQAALDKVNLEGRAMLKRRSSAEHTPRPKSSIDVVKIPSTIQARLTRPLRRAAKRSQAERRTSALFEGGALDSQVSDSQYIDSLESASGIQAQEPRSSVEELRESSPMQARGPNEGLNSSSEVGEDEYPPGQMEFLERYGSTDEELTETKSEQPQPLLHAEAQTAQCANQVPVSLMLLPPEDLAPLLDISDTLNWYRRDAEQSRTRIRAVEEAHRSLLLQYEELLSVNEELMAALEAAGLPIP